MGSCKYLYNLKHHQIWSTNHQLESYTPPDLVHHIESYTQSDLVYYHQENIPYRISLHNNVLFFFIDSASSKTVFYFITHKNLVHELHYQNCILYFVKIQIEILRFDEIGDVWFPDQIWLKNPNWKLECCAANA